MTTYSNVVNNYYQSTSNQLISREGDNRDTLDTLATDDTTPPLSSEAMSCLLLLYNDAAPFCDGSFSRKSSRQSQTFFYSNIINSFSWNICFISFLILYHQWLNWKNLFYIFFLYHQLIRLEYLFYLL